MRHFNKHYGLKKLRKIAGNEHPHWTVAPHVTLTSVKQFRLPQVKGAKRVLVRTDEAGREYKNLSWDHMPRGDVANTLSERNIRENIFSIHAKRPVIAPIEQSRILLHPTRPRGDIAFAGRGWIETMHEGGPTLNVYLHKNPPTFVEQHRSLPTKKFHFELRNGQFVEEAGTRKFGQALERLSPVHTRQTIVRQRFVDFINHAIAQGHIKPNRKFTEVSFVTYKDKPTVLEFYDLIEKRVR